MKKLVKVSIQVKTNNDLCSAKCYWLYDSRPLVECDLFNKKLKRTHDGEPKRCKRCLDMQVEPS